MSLPDFNYFIGVKITLKLISAPATTKDVWFCNRANLSNTALSATTYYWPILQGLSELGVEMDQYLPGQSGGSFTIDNTIGTFGDQRKFSDLLQRYTAIECPVTAYLYEGQLDAESITFGNDQKVWSGKIENLENPISAESSSLLFK